nr:HSP70-like protein [Grapevine leafroll-associated virus 4]
MEVGIDFGTTFSTLCFSPGRGTDGCVPESDTIYIPTVVGLRTDGTYTVGLGALQESGLTVYRDIKRYFGMNQYNEREYREKLKPTFEVVVDEWSVAIGPVNGEKGKARSVVALACLFVSALAKIAVKVTNSPISISVCSVPAEYSSYMRSFIFESCSLAKISVQAVVNEPTAAGLSAFVNIDKRDLKYMVVYDFGGGTFDASLMVVGSAFVCVIDSLGDNYLGGRDVDNALAAAICAQLKLTSEAVDPFAMEALKIDLVREPNKVNREILTKGGEVKQISFSGEEFRILCKPFVSRAAALVEKLLKRRNIDSCVAVLIGGSAVLPGVRNSIASLRGVSQVLFDVNTYRAAVAIGAAIYAQTFSGASRYRLIDCVSNSLSDERLPLKAVAVFPKGHPIPSIVTVDFKMPSYDTGLVLHEGESAFINRNARTFSASIPTKTFPPKRTYKQVFSVSEDGRLSVTMDGIELRNTVVQKSPPAHQYSEVFVSSDDKRIGPEVVAIKSFYAKLLKSQTLTSSSLIDRRKVYSEHGIICD